MRRAAKRDANEMSIVKALETAGWCVLRLSQPGLPDLLCLKGSATVLLEVKMPGKGLTVDQQETLDKAEKVGHHGFDVVRTPEAAMTVAASRFIR